MKPANENITAISFISFVVFCFVYTTPVFALSPDSLCTVTGKITDRETGHPLYNVNVAVAGTTMGTTSDSTGRYQLSLPPGEYRFSISHIGYKTWRQHVIIRSDRKTFVLDARLESLAVRLPGVTVTEDRARKSVSRYGIKAPSLRNMASPLPDVLLTLQTLPGVASLDDQSTLYNVRGGNFDENLIYINGIEIYQPQLVRKGIMENPSLVNPALLESIDLRTGAFPVSYGDKLSSVLDIHYREEFARKVTAQAEMSAVGVNGALGLHPRKNVWLQLAMRRISYGYLFKKSLEVDADYSPLFTDFQGLLHVRPSQDFDVSLLALRASSDYGAKLVDTELRLRLPSQEFGFRFGGKEEYIQSSNLLGLTLRYHPKGRLSFEWVNSYFGQNEDENTDRSMAISNGYIDSLRRQENIHDFYDADFYSSRAAVQWLVSSSVLVNAGIDFKHFTLRDSLLSLVRQWQDTGEVYQLPEENYSESLRRRTGSVFGRFIQSNVELSNRLGLQFGLRWTKSSLNGEQLFLPRGRITYRFSDVSRVTLAVGNYAQPPVYKEFQFRKGEDAGLHAQKATQFTLGFQRLLENGLSLKVEAYYKRYRDLISYSLQDVQIKYSGENDARGYAYGLDAYLHGEIIPGTENWISYSYLVARDDLLNDNEGYAPRASDRRHQLAIFNQDKMETLPWSKLFMRMVVGTGYPFTPQRWILDNDTNTHHLENGRRNSERLRFYLRFDLGFSQQFKLSKNTRFLLREEILNLYDIRNMIGYDMAFGHLIRQPLSGRVFNVGVRAEF